MIHIVIARHKENIDWVDKLKLPKDSKVFVYEKGGLTSKYNDIVLRNIGRESHSYCTHIVRNYNRLADWTIFLQGHPFDHKVNLDMVQQVIDNYKRLSRPLVNFAIGSASFAVCDVQDPGGLAWDDTRSRNLKSRPDMFTLRKAYDILFENDYDDVRGKFLSYMVSAQFGVHKSILKQHGKEGWETLKNYHYIDDAAAWNMEHMWPLILNPDIRINKTIFSRNYNRYKKPMFIDDTKLP